MAHWINHTNFSCFLRLIMHNAYKGSRSRVHKTDTNECKFGLGCIEPLHQSCIFPLVPSTFPLHMYTLARMLLVECIDGVAIHIGRPLVEATVANNEHCSTHVTRVTQETSEVDIIRSIQSAFSNACTVRVP